MQAFQQLFKVLSFSLDTSPNSFSPRQTPCRQWFVQSQPWPPGAASARPSRVLVSCTRAPAGSLKSCNRPGWGLECSAATSPVEWNLVFLGVKMWPSNVQRAGEPARSRLAGCYCCYDNRGGGSRPISNFSVPVGWQMDGVSFCQKLPMNDLVWWSYDNMLQGSGFFKHSV